MVKRNQQKNQEAPKKQGMMQEEFGVEQTFGRQPQKQQNGKIKQNQNQNNN